MRNTNLVVAAERFTNEPFYQPSVEYVRLPHAFPEIPSVPGMRRLARYLARLDAHFYRRALVRHLKGRGIDIVHGHFAHIAWEFRNLKKALGAPLVVSFYGWDYERISVIDPSWKSRMKQLFAISDAIICEGPHGARVLEQLDCPASKLHVCPLGVDPGSIPYFARSKRSGELRLLQVASFREKKGHLDAVRAFARVAGSCPNASLTLVGSGDPRVLDRVRREISRLGQEDRVQLLPPVPFAEVHGLMKDYHVFIHPSLYTGDRDCEGGAPVVLLDAQCTGLPIISTLHCDIPQVVQHDRTGLLVAERDETGLACAIARFYRMGQQEYDGFSERARKHVQLNFDMDTCAAKVEQIYRDLTTSRVRA